MIKYKSYRPIGQTYWMIMNENREVLSQGWSSKEEAEKAITHIQGMDWVTALMILGLYTALQMHRNTHSAL